MANIDLSLLKSLVAELEASMKTTEENKKTAEKHQYVLNMSKCMGLAVSIANESTALIADMKSVIAQSSIPGKEDALAKIISVLANPNGLPETN
jgi:hypothetical protein